MDFRNLKKGLLISLLIANTAVVFAGGVQSKEKQTSTTTYSGVYLEGNAGYASRNWESSINTSNINNVSWINKDGGVIGGVDLGYQFNKYVAIEGGWEYLPTMTFRIAGLVKDKVEGWVAYAGPKVMVPLFNATFLFFKVGASYVYNKNRPPIAVASIIGGTKSNYWSGFAGLGLQFYITREVSLSLQAAYVPGRSISVPSATRFGVPETYYYVGALGYKFML